MLDDLLPATSKLVELKAIDAAQLERNYRLLKELEAPQVLCGAVPSAQDTARAMLDVLAATAYRCSSTAWALGTSAILCGRALEVGRGRPLWDSWRAKIETGAVHGCFSISEWGPMSDPASVTSRLTKQSDGTFVAQGEKTRVTNLQYADLAVVIVRNAAGTDLSFALVELKRAGIAQREIEKMGLSGMSWGVLTLDALPLPAEAVVENVGLAQVVSVTEWGQCMIGAIALGQLRRLIDTTRRYVSEISSFGRRLIELDHIHSALELATLDARWLDELLVAAFVSKVERVPPPATLGLAKAFATERAVQLAVDAMRFFGAWGWSAEFAVERILRDCLGNVAGGMANERILEIAGATALGQNPWSYPQLVKTAEQPTDGRPRTR